MSHSQPVIYWILFALVMVFVVVSCSKIGPWIEEMTGSFVLRLCGCFAFGYGVGSLFQVLMK